MAFDEEHTKWVLCNRWVVGTVIHGVLLSVITHLWSSLDKHRVHTHTYFWYWMCCVPNELRVHFQNKQEGGHVSKLAACQVNLKLVRPQLRFWHLFSVREEMRMSVTWTAARNWLSVRMTSRWRAQVSWKSSKLAGAAWANGLTPHECWISWRHWATPLSRHPNASIQTPTSSLHCGFPGVLHYLT